MRSRSLFPFLVPDGIHTAYSIAIPSILQTKSFESTCPGVMRMG